MPPRSCGASNSAGALRMPGALGKNGAAASLLNPLPEKFAKYSREIVPVVNTLLTVIVDAGNNASLSAYVVTLRSIAGALLLITLVVTWNESPGVAVLLAIFATTGGAALLESARAATNVITE